MDGIHHRFIQANGLNLHYAEAGSGDKVVVFLHGFPEIWYSWRHQMIAAADSGLRALAPDYRGYGLSDPPPEPERTKYMDLIGDLHEMLKALGISKCVVVGKDFGARVAYLYALKHPENVAGVVTLGSPFMPPGAIKSGDYFREGTYISRWQKPERAEADFDRFDAKTVVRKIYILFSGHEVPVANEDQEIMDLVDDSSAALPPWFSEEDLEVYGALYQKSGFRTAMQIPYRWSIWEDIGIKEMIVRVPALLIIGEKDYVLKFHGREEFVKSGKAQESVPDLEVVYLPEGSHFVQEQFPEQVNRLICEFLGSRIWPS
ncbi:Epoxide hydrolase A [Linum grandiflorum]